MKSLVDKQWCNQPIYQRLALEGEIIILCFLRTEDNVKIDRFEWKQDSKAIIWLDISILEKIHNTKMNTKWTQKILEKIYNTKMKN